MTATLAFYLAAIPAVLIFGISKGGFGGGLGVVAVPLMALVIAPADAAAIMLPILCLMDIMGLWAYRRDWDARAVRLMLPASAIGILIGAAVFRLLSDDLVRLVIGAIAILFTVQHYARGAGRDQPRDPGRIAGFIWSATAGFTSTLAHAGGPPANMYLLPQRLKPRVFVATMVVVFAFVNYVKLLPYWWLGLFTFGNLEAALTLAPVAALGMWLGIRLQGRLPVGLFYRLCYLFVLITGLKLVYDGLTPG